MYHHAQYPPDDEISALIALALAYYPSLTVRQMSDLDRFLLRIEFRWKMNYASQSLENLSENDIILLDPIS